VVYQQDHSVVTVQAYIRFVVHGEYPLKICWLEIAAASNKEWGAGCRVSCF